MHRTSLLRLVASTYLPQSPLYLSLIHTKPVIYSVFLISQTLPTPIHRLSFKLLAVRTLTIPIASLASTYPGISLGPSARSCHHIPPPRLENASNGDVH